MKERFDSWKGFLDAGFESADDGSLRLGDAVVSYSVAKETGGLRVKFSGDVPGYEDIAFSLPSEVDDLYEWAARIAYGTFGASENWKRFREKLGGLMNRDLEQMIIIGIDHLDEIEADGAGVTEDIEETSGDDSVIEEVPTDDPKEDGASCVLGDDWSSCLREIVKKELAGEWRKLSDAAQARDIARSQSVMDRVNRLKMMDEKIAELAEEWQALGLVDKVGKRCLTRFANFEEVQRNEEDADLFGRRQPAVGDGTPTLPNGARGIARPTKPVISPKPEPKGPMGFAVTFEDGVRIAEAKASVTFAKVIEKIGAERVAALGLRMADDPLVTQDKSEIKKMPMMVQSVADGWFVKTHSNTYTKMDFLRRIGEALGVGMKFETFRRELIEKPGRSSFTTRRDSASPKKRGRGRPPKHLRKREAFQIGRVVKWAFPKVFENGNVSEEEIALFLSDESKRKFGTRGYPVLKESNGSAEEHIVNGQRRYYADVRLEHAGHAYLLTSQFITANAEPILAWLETKGLSRADMDRVGRGEKTVPSLFPEMTAFENDEVHDEPRRDPESSSVIPAPLELVSDDPQPTLFDQVRVEELVPKSDSTDVMIEQKDISASVVKKALRREMKRLTYTPGSLAAGLHLPFRLVKGWYKGRGVIKPEEYKALCRFMGIEKLAAR